VPLPLPPPTKPHCWSALPHFAGAASPPPCRCRQAPHLYSTVSFCLDMGPLLLPASLGSSTLATLNCAQVDVFMG